MSKLLLTFYGDDFTGSTDALEQLTLAGIRTMLFIDPPTAKQLARFKNLQAIGVAGLTRSMTPRAMERELKPVLKKLKTLRARHIHYKVCSTFDSSPTIGNIGRVIELASKFFSSPFIPILAAAPALGRYTVFGNHFARYGIGSTGAIHRLDRHPSISKHPITPMTEADLRQHLAKQTKKRVALFDILKVSLPMEAARSELKYLLKEKPDAVLFDALLPEHLVTIGKLLEPYSTAGRPQFSIGSSGIETALGAIWSKKRFSGTRVASAKQILVGSGSCSLVTCGQIAWAVKHGFAEVPLNPVGLVSRENSAKEIRRAAAAVGKLLAARRSVIVHTTRGGSDKRISTKLRTDAAKVLGAALGCVLCEALTQSKVTRVCIAGGDTSSYAARALGIEALEMIAPLTPGAPLCRAYAVNSPINGREVVFKGGQVGAEDYFGVVLKGQR